MMSSFYTLLALYLLSFISLNTSAKSIPELEYLASVNAITQDEMGYIWLANNQGLTRFDGKNIITFSSNNNHWPLPFSHPHDMSSVGNKILISTENNRLWEFDPKNGSALAIGINTDNSSIYNAVEFQGNYYAFSKSPDHLYRYDPKNQQTIKLQENIQLSQLVRTNNKLYFSSNNALFEITPNKISKILTLDITSISTAGNSLIVATANKLYYFSDSGQTKSIDIGEKVYAITPENSRVDGAGDNFYTINIKGKIRKYHTSSLTELTHKYSDTKPQHTRAMLQDNSGGLWLLTNLGLQLITEKKMVNHPLHFDIYYNNFSLQKIKGELIIGTYGQGLHPFTEDVTSSSTNNEPILTSEVNQHFSKRGKIIYSMLSVGDDLYIATFDGLWLYQSKSKELKRIDIPDNILIFLDMTLKDNLLYIGTNSNGLLIFDVAQQKLLLHLGKGSGLSSLEVNGILPLDNGEIWITTAVGLDIYNHKAKTLRKVSIPASSKIGTLVLADNKIFVATMGSGIFVFNRQGELISRFASGITFYYLKVINGEIWAPADPGLYRINPTDYQITMVPDTELLSFTDSPLQVDHKLYIPHSRGILELPLIDEKTFNAKVYISKTTVSGNSSIINKTINVDSPNDVITLELASLDYRPGQEKQYKYRINNGSWNEVYGHQLTLTGLGSGLYDIEIMGTNSFGQWSSYKAYTTINVAYPWYWSMTMRIVYALIFLIVITKLFWLLFMRAKSITKIHRILNADMKNRGKAALNVSRNLAYVLELLNQTDESRLEKSRSIIQQSIDELKSNTDAKQPDGLYGNSLEVALPFFSDYLQQKYHINLSNTIELNDISLAYEMQSDIYKIIYESITSAILNGNGRNFTMALKEVKSKVWINISDDGNSFLNFNNNINFNMAMYYTRKIAKKYNASVHIFNKQDKGSQLAISIPLMDIT
ncbi:ligand-binding sensor domain-containing protein [Thalassomonas haliotis]|uniref:Two component regulator three Y domain-containing protein n=1 Tax=Thalassomonas haliotis TaxID=485448 RepID=A0ABY7VB06_9GAMM|nr:hypothetical protein [Thalassomonas haliotis]WDE10491.1 hypothetical protein H3N35_19820 [Thalassomonas haliotis]